MGGDWAGGIEVGHLGGGVDAGVGAPCCDDPGRALRIERGNGLLQTGLNTLMMTLTLPAVKGGALILQAEGNASDGGPFGAVAGLRMAAGELRAGQTSSMMAISALSPRRLTVRMMRV